VLQYPVLGRFAIIAIILCAVTINLAQKAQQRPTKKEQSPVADAPKTVTFINNESAATPAQGTQNKSPNWYVSPEWPLVIVGIFTLLAIWYQARETARATKAMQKSVQLQEIELRQWVDITNWRSEVRTVQNETILEIYFDVVNPTKIPITLIAVSITIGGQRSDSGGRTLLAPNNPHTASTSFRFNKEQEEARWI
jgi:hypothetical protein